MVKNSLPSIRPSNKKGMVIPAISPYEAIADFEILRPMTMNSSAIQPKQQPMRDRSRALLYSVITSYSASVARGSALRKKLKSRGS